MDPLQEALRELLREASAMAEKDTRDFIEYELEGFSLGGPERRRMYAEGLRISVDIDRQTFRLEIVTSAAKTIEQGVPAVDLRSMLSGPSAKVAEDGSRYVDIPFFTASRKEAGRPDVLAPKTLNAGLPSHPRQATPRAVVDANVERTLENRLLEAGGYGSVRLKRGEFAQTDKGVGKSKHSHAYGLSQGTIMHAGISPYAKVSRFGTIRRLSDNSDPSSWIVPAQPGVHLRSHLEQVASDYYGQRLLIRLEELRRIAGL